MVIPENFLLDTNHNKMTLVSHNTKHFTRIEGLKLTDWQ